MALFNKKQLTSSAEVVDKHLILSLPNAIEPIVWRMALDKIGTASFEIKSVKKGTVFNLVMKAKKGAAETIAPFNQKEEALDALMKASNALQKPEISNNNTATATVKKISNKTAANPPHTNNNKWLYLLLGALFVVGLYFYMINQIPTTISNLGNNAPNLSSGNNAQPQTGVPLSADDFLNGL